LGPQGLRERVESVALLPELTELGVHLVEGVVLVAGAVLELLTKTNKCRAARSKRGNDKIKGKNNSILPGKRATPGHRGSAVPRSTPG
jgi:hypothetical protein